MSVKEATRRLQQVPDDPNKETAAKLFRAAGLNQRARAVEEGGEFTAEEIRDVKLDLFKELEAEQARGKLASRAKKKIQRIPNEPHQETAAKLFEIAGLSRRAREVKGGGKFTPEEIKRVKSRISGALEAEALEEEEPTRMERLKRRWPKQPIFSGAGGEIDPKRQLGHFAPEGYKDYWDTVEALKRRRRRIRPELSQRQLRKLPPIEDIAAQEVWGERPEAHPAAALYGSLYGLAQTLTTENFHLLGITDDDKYRQVLAKAQEIYWKTPLIQRDMWDRYFSKPASKAAPKGAERDVRFLFNRYPDIALGVFAGEDVVPMPEYGGPEAPLHEKIVGTVGRATAYFVKMWAIRGLMPGSSAGAVSSLYRRSFAAGVASQLRGADPSLSGAIFNAFTYAGLMGISGMASSGAVKALEKAGFKGLGRWIARGLSKKVGLQPAIAKSLRKGGQVARGIIIGDMDDYVESIGETTYYALAQRPDGVTAWQAWWAALPTNVLFNRFEEVPGTVGSFAKLGPSQLEKGVAEEFSRMLGHAHLKDVRTILGGQLSEKEDEVLTKAERIYRNPMDVEKRSELLSGLEPELNSLILRADRERTEMPEQEKRRLLLTAGRSGGEGIEDEVLGEDRIIGVTRPELHLPGERVYVEDKEGEGYRQGRLVEYDEEEGIATVDVPKEGTRYTEHFYIGTDKEGNPKGLTSGIDVATGQGKVPVRPGEISEDERPYLLERGLSREEMRENLSGRRPGVVLWNAPPGSERFKLFREKILPYLEDNIPSYLRRYPLDVVLVDRDNLEKMRSFFGGDRLDEEVWNDVKAGLSSMSAAVFAGGQMTLFNKGTPQNWLRAFTHEMGHVVDVRKEISPLLREKVEDQLIEDGARLIQGLQEAGEVEEGDVVDRLLKRDEPNILDELYSWARNHEEAIVRVAKEQQLAGVKEDWDSLDMNALYPSYAMMYTLARKQGFSLRVVGKRVDQEAVSELVARNPEWRRMLFAGSWQRRWTKAKRGVSTSNIHDLIQMDSEKLDVFERHGLLDESARDVYETGGKRFVSAETAKFLEDAQDRGIPSVLMRQVHDSGEIDSIKVRLKPKKFGTSGKGIIFRKLLSRQLKKVGTKEEQRILKDGLKRVDKGLKLRHLKRAARAAKKLREKAKTKDLPKKEREEVRDEIFSRSAIKRMEKLSQKKVDELSIEDIQFANNIIGTLAYKRENLDEFIARTEEQRIPKAVQAIGRSLDKNNKGKREHGILQFKPFNLLKQWFSSGNYNLEHHIMLLEGGKLKDILWRFLYKSVNGAYDKWKNLKDGHTATIRRLFQERNVDLKEGFDRWVEGQRGSTERRKIELSNQTVNLTPGQLVSFYLTTERTTLEEGEEVLLGLQHLLSEEGFQVEHSKRGWLVGRKREIERFDKLTKEDIRKLREELRPEERKVANALLRYMKTTAKETANRASLQMDGERIATDPVYWPLHVAKEYIGRDPQVEQPPLAVARRHLEGMGYLKETEPEAKSPIVIRDAFDEVNEYMASMTAYAAFAPVMRDVRAIINDSSIQNKIKAYGGQDWYKHMKAQIDWIEDRSLRPDVLGRTLVNISNRAAGAILLAYPMIWTAQAFSYPLIASHVPVRTMARYMRPLSKREKQEGMEIINRSPQLKERIELGKFTREAGSLNPADSLDRWLVERKTLKQKAGAGLAAGDKAAIVRIALAARDWMEETGGDLEPDLQYEPTPENVTKLTNDLVRWTQPTWMGKDRSYWGAHPSTAARLTTLFHSFLEKAMMNTRLAIKRHSAGLIPLRKLIAALTSVAVSLIFFNEGKYQYRRRVWRPVLGREYEGGGWRDFVARQIGNVSGLWYWLPEAFNAMRAQFKFGPQVEFHMSLIGDTFSVGADAIREGTRAMSDLAAGEERERGARAGTKKWPSELRRSVESLGKVIGRLTGTPIEGFIEIERHYRIGQKQEQSKSNWDLYVPPKGEED